MRNGDIPTIERLDAMTETEYQAYEHRVRRLARGHGFELRRIRRRDTRTMNHGKYTLVRVEETRRGKWRSRTLFSYEHGLALPAIHRLLNERQG